MKAPPAFVAYCDLEEHTGTFLSLLIPRLPHFGLYLTHMTTGSMFPRDLLRLQTLLGEEDLVRGVSFLWYAGQ